MIASSFNCIETFKKEIKVLDSAIEREIKGLNPNAFMILQSIDGIGAVFAAGNIAEIGDISAFHSSDVLAKYAGLVWKSNQSGDFNGEDTPMAKAGNRFTRLLSLDITPFKYSFSLNYYTLPKRKQTAFYKGFIHSAKIL